MQMKVTDKSKNEIDPDASTGGAAAAAASGAAFAFTTVFKLFATVAPAEQHVGDAYKGPLKGRFKGPFQGRIRPSEGSDGRNVEL